MYFEQVSLLNTVHLNLPVNKPVCLFSFAIPSTLLELDLRLFSFINVILSLIKKNKIIYKQFNDFSCVCSLPVLADMNNCYYYHFVFHFRYHILFWTFLPFSKFLI